MQTFGIVSQAKNRFVTNIGVFVIDHYDEKDTGRKIYKLSLQDNFGRENLLGRFPSYEDTLAELAKVAKSYGATADWMYEVTPGSNTRN